MLAEKFFKEKFGIGRKEFLDMYIFDADALVGFCGYKITCRWGLRGVEFVVVPQ